MFSFFESKEKKYVKSHIRHLVRLAKADGLLHRDEVKFIKDVGKKNGLQDAEIKEIIENPTSVNISVPDNDSERFDQIFDLVQMMMKDGVVNDAEMEFCMELANRLGFRKVIVGVLVAKITRGIEAGIGKEELKEETKPFLDI